MIRLPPPAALLLLAVVLAPAPLRAQEERWNEREALALVARARDARQADAVDPERRAYQAVATGHVFFLVDRPSTGERSLVKADQIAIQVYWRAPRATRQRIVGMRDQKVLPTNIRYHLDHLTVVQDDFGDVIRIGDGDEVSSVVHPLAPLAEEAYDFALGDAVAIDFPDGGRVDVQELRVRPRALDRPGFVGSVYVDRGSAAVVRMKFTFTPASYVDDYLDYIQISLDNSLWEGRWWLPYRQELELRREMPQLDFLVGSVIRGRFDIGEYVLNPELGDSLFAGSRVTAVPEAERRAYAFSEPLVPPVEGDELDPTPTLQEIRAEALRLTAGRYLSGLSRFRPYVPTASDVVRWNRAEGTFVGAGAAWRMDGRGTLRAHGGWAFGRGEPSGSLTYEDAEARAGIRASWNELRDLGPFAGAPGALNTVTALLADQDWLDPWLSSGVELFGTVAPGAAPFRLGLRAERHERARLAVDADADFRPLPAIAEGWLLSVEGARETPLGRGFGLDVTARLATFGPEVATGRASFGTLGAALTWERGVPSGPRWLARADGGVALGDFPVQERFHLGGRETLPGHPYRAQVGDAFWLVRAEVSRPLLDPWVTVRALAAAGATGVIDADEAMQGTASMFTRDGVKASAGAGLGLGWDVLHLDVARGLDGGEWELVVSVDRRFRGWL